MGEREERMAPSPADLVAYRALSEEEARRKFKSKQSRNSGGGAEGPASTSVKKRKSKKLTLKKILDASQLDKLAPGKANWSTIEVGPSLLPKKKYSDISGFEAPYTEPKTKLRYASTKEYQAIQAMSQELVGARLALRGANVTKL